MIFFLKKMKIWGFSCEGFVLGHWGENSGTRMENPMKMRQQVCWEEMVPDVTEGWAHAWESSQWPKWRTAVEESRRATAPPSPSACWHKRPKASSFPSLLTHLPGEWAHIPEPRDPPAPLLRASYTRKGHGVTSNNITSIQSCAAAPSHVRGREKGEARQGTFFIAFSRFKY